MLGACMLLLGVKKMIAYIKQAEKLTDTQVLDFVNRTKYLDEKRDIIIYDMMKNKIKRKNDLKKDDWDILTGNRCQHVELGVSKSISIASLLLFDRVILNIYYSVIGFTVRYLMMKYKINLAYVFTHHRNAGYEPHLHSHILFIVGDDTKINECESVTLRLITDLELERLLVENRYKYYWEVKSDGQDAIEVQLNSNLDFSKYISEIYQNQGKGVKMVKEQLKLKGINSNKIANYQYRKDKELQKKLQKVQYDKNKFRSLMKYWHAIASCYNIVVNNIRKAYYSFQYC